MFGDLLSGSGIIVAVARSLALGGNVRKEGGEGRTLHFISFLSSVLSLYSKQCSTNRRKKEARRKMKLNMVYFQDRKNPFFISDIISLLRHYSSNEMEKDVPIPRQVLFMCLS